MPRAMSAQVATPSPVWVGERAITKGVANRVGWFWAVSGERYPPRDRWTRLGEVVGGHEDVEISVTLDPDFSSVHCVIAAGGSRTVAAEGVGVHRGTIYESLRRGTEDANATQTALDPDDYTAIELRTMAHDAGIAGFSRMDKAELATAIAATPSDFSAFSDNIKKAEAEAENESLAGIARIARGAGIMTTVTEELDGAGNVKTRTTRTVTGLGSWQAYAWLLERRHPDRWARTERSAIGGTAGTLDPEEVIARGEAQLRVIEGGQE